MIPTRYRAKIRRGLAFPIGAELLSEALAGTPQELSLSVSFHDKPTVFASDFEELLRAGAPLPVLRVVFQKQPPGLSGSNALIEAGHYDVTWLLDVYPVPAPLKSLVQGHLEASGLRRIRVWLETPRPETWQRGRRSLTLLFDASANTLTALED